jgi:tRNA(fMet)-specific endonuclease VapC
MADRTLITHMLDTNVCVRHLNNRAPMLTTRLESFNVQQLAVCSVVKAELYFGSRRSQNPERSRQKQDRFLSKLKSFPFDDDAAEKYAVIRADLSKIGNIIGPSDMMIAAIALANNLILVTHNTAEFGRVQGLKLEDWELPD